MSDKSKILVCGDVNGNFKTLFKRVEGINRKNGPFDFLLCVGNFFGSSTDSWEPYRNGSIEVPVPTYILGPNEEEHVAMYPDINGGELCTNVSYIGRRGLFRRTTGLKLAYVSGVETTGEQAHKYGFTANDVMTVKDVCIRSQPNFRGVDILATSVWPRGVMNLDQRGNQREPNGSFLLSWLAAQIKPRYHFCAQEGFYYERRPYRNHCASNSSAEHATRFIALAKVGNPEKQKWLYALSLDPAEKMKPVTLYQQTTDETECPYTGSMLHDSVTNNYKQQDKPEQFFYDMTTPVDNSQRKRHRKGEGVGPDRKQRPVFDQETCWFCLASAEVEKHLVISIGNEVYLAMAKGGLVADHVLILPVGHHQSLSCAPDSVLKEIKQFKSALKKYFSKHQKVPVFFERNYKTSHLQIQVVPVDSEVAVELKMVFQDSAEAEGFQLDELPEHAKLQQIAPPGTPYFYVELPTGQSLFHRVCKSFPIQFGREVLASRPVLNMEDRADWRDCKISKEDETILTKQFRTAFQEFDFTLI